METTAKFTFPKLLFKTFGNYFWKILLVITFGYYFSILDLEVNIGSR